MADTAVISSKLRDSELEFKQFNVCKSDVKILETANAYQLKVKGAIEVTLNINNKTLKIPFVIIDYVSTQIVLGQNFFQKYKAIIGYDKSHITLYIPQ